MMGGGFDPEFLASRMPGMLRALQTMGGAGAPAPAPTMAEKPMEKPIVEQEPSITTSTVTAPAKRTPWWKRFNAPLSYDEWKVSTKKGPAYYRTAHGDTEEAYKKWLAMKKARWQDQVDGRNSLQAKPLQTRLVKRGAALPDATVDNIG